MGFKAIGVKSVGKDVESVCEKVGEVELVEGFSKVWSRVEALEDAGECVKSDVVERWEFVLDGPNDAIDDGFELFLFDVEEDLEAFGDHGLDKDEEVGPVFRERAEVCCDHREDSF